MTAMKDKNNDAGKLNPPVTDRNITTTTTNGSVEVAARISSMIDSTAVVFC